MSVQRNQYRKYLIDGAQVEVGAIPIESSSSAQAITGTGFSSTNGFGSATLSTSYNITGAGFSDTNDFGAGTISASYSIAGTGFSSTNSFGSGTVSLSGGAQSITGVGFSSTNLFGSGLITTSDGFIDIDGVLPRFDRRTLRKLKKKFSEYTYQEQRDRDFKRKVREALESSAAEKPTQEPTIEPIQAAPQQAQIIETRKLPEIDWTQFDELLAKLEVGSLQRQRLMLLKQKERQQAIAEYEAQVLRAFEQVYLQNKAEKRRRLINDMMLHFLLDD